MKKGKAEAYMEFCFFLLLLTVYMHGIGKLFGPIRFPDEFGYWSHGARLLGYDWNEVSGIHPYYSFGYGMLMAPLLKWCSNPVVLYRIAVSINFIMIVWCYVLLKKILVILFHAPAYPFMTLFSGLAILYSSFMVYAQTTLPEILLALLYLLLIASVLMFFQKPSAYYMGAMAAISAGLYFVHMRTLGIGMALWLVLVWEAVINKDIRAHVLTGALAYGILIIAGMVYKNNYIDEIYGVSGGSLAALNDFSGQIEKLGKLTNIKGMADFICSLGGKLFYLGSATGGLFYWGIMSLHSMTACSIRHKMIAARFVLLSALFTLSIVSLFMIDTPRVDGVIYGRYSEILLPIFIGTGLTAMVRSPSMWKVSFGIICFQSVMMYLVNWKISSSGAYGIYRHSIPAVAYALELSSNRVFAFTKNVYLGGVFLGLTMAGVLWIVRQRERFWYLAFLWAVIQWGLGMDVCVQMNYKYNKDNYQDIMIAEQIKDMVGDYERIVFLYSDGYGYVDLLQFCLKEKSVYVLKEPYGSIGDVTQEDIVVTSRRDIFSKELSQTYGTKRESAHFEVYYNEK